MVVVGASYITYRYRQETGRRKLAIDTGMYHRTVDKPFPATAQDRESMSSLRTRIGDSSNSSNQ